MADNSSPDYKSLFLQSEERRKQAEERSRKAEDRIKKTTFEELLCHCHKLLSRPLKVETPSRSTTGKIPLPTGKYCPTQLLPWKNCHIQQQEIYDAVCRYLQPAAEKALRLFPPLIELEGISRRFSLQPISSEQGLESYERFAVEHHVRDIIAELCNIPSARKEFELGDGIWFDNHTNALSEAEVIETDAAHRHTVRRPRPDQFCINRVDGNTNTLLLTAEYKPPHKLSVENFRAGLRPMRLWEEMVKRNKTPTDPKEKLQYNTERLVNSAIVQEYHVMIEEGRAYSYVTNGLARVLLYVPYEDPSTLYYYLCDPNREVNEQDEQRLQEPKTSIARVLCLCLMSYHAPTRDQEWRNFARSQLNTWKTSFDHIHSQIPKIDLQQYPLHSDSTDSEYVTPEPSSEYAPSSPLLESPTGEGRRVPTRSQASCAPSDARPDTESPESSDSDTNQAASGQKRGFSQVTSSPSAQRQARQRDAGKHQSSRSQPHDAKFCTQGCLLGLQNGGTLDQHCPNVELHRQGGDECHSINAKELVQLLKTQLDENIDQNCTPFGECGSYGAPFKLTCAAYGYTVVGKGTTSGLWKEVSQEIQVYQMLRKAQGSAVPVFLGQVDLEKIYFLHGAGKIRHMLIMSWGGQRITMEQSSVLLKQISRSRKEIRALGIIHCDPRLENILYNEEVNRVFFIDFHCSKLDPQRKLERPQPTKRPRGTDTQKAKRLCVS